MKKLSLSLIAIAVSFSLYNYDSTSYAIGIPKNETSNSQCLINVPKFERPIVNGDIHYRLTQNLMNLKRFILI